MRECFNFFSILNFSLCDRSDEFGSNKFVIPEILKWTFQRKNIFKVTGFQYIGEHESQTGLASTVPKKVFRVLDTIVILLTDFPLFV